MLVYRFQRILEPPETKWLYPPNDLALDQGQRDRPKHSRVPGRRQVVTDNPAVALRHLAGTCEQTVDDDGTDKRDSAAADP